MTLADRGRAIRERVAQEPMRRPPFDAAEMDEARDLDRRAATIHREADEERNPHRRAGLRTMAVQMAMRADEIVPVEHRG